MTVATALYTKLSELIIIINNKKKQKLTVGAASAAPVS